MKYDGYYLGIDVGSVSTNLVIINEHDKVVEKLYLRTSGQPINVLIKGMQLLADKFGKRAHIKGVGTTGSGRQLASVIVGADIVKNEITSHAIAAQKAVPGVKTVLEIGWTGLKNYYSEKRSSIRFCYEYSLCCWNGVIFRQTGSPA